MMMMMIRCNGLKWNQRHLTQWEACSAPGDQYKSLHPLPVKARWFACKSLHLAPGIKWRHDALNTRNKHLLIHL